MLFFPLESRTIAGSLQIPSLRKLKLLKKQKSSLVIVILSKDKIVIGDAQARMRGML